MGRRRQNQNLFLKIIGVVMNAAVRQSSGVQNGPVAADGTWYGRLETFEVHSGWESPSEST